jgi:hypothetical protein
MHDMETEQVEVPQATNKPDMSKIFTMHDAEAFRIEMTVAMHKTSEHEPS